MALVVILAVLGVAWALSYVWLNNEARDEITAQNPGGSAGSALVVYHPGPGTFHRRVVAGFVEGLVAGGWRVDVSPANAQANVDLSGYDLLVLGSPTYYFAPSAPIRRYLGRLGDLGGKPTVTIVTGLGAGGRSSSILQKRIREAHGSLIESLTLYRMRPNDDENYSGGEQNRALAVDMAREAARSLAPVAECGSGRVPRGPGPRFTHLP